MRISDWSSDVCSSDLGFIDFIYLFLIHFLYAEFAISDLGLGKFPELVVFVIAFQEVVEGVQGFVIPGGCSQTDGMIKLSHWVFLVVQHFGVPVNGCSIVLVQAE